MIVEIKQRKPRYGCPRIAEQISKIFGVEIDKDVVRRVLAKHYYPPPGTGEGPSRLTFIGHAKDSLWSLDLFRCEYRTHSTLEGNTPEETAGGALNSQTTLNRFSWQEHCRGLYHLPIPA